MAEGKGSHLVIWEMVARPVEFEGLGIGNLSVHN